MIPYKQSEIQELCNNNCNKLGTNKESRFQTDVGGQHCPCPVRVSFLSGFSGKSCPVSVRCPDSVRIFCQVSVCPDSVCLDYVSCPDSVQIFRQNAVLCLSVRIFLSRSCPLSGFCRDFLKKRLSAVCLSGFRSKIVCPVPVSIFSASLR